MVEKTQQFNIKQIDLKCIIGHVYYVVLVIVKTNLFEFSDWKKNVNFFEKEKTNKKNKRNES